MIAGFLGEKGGIFQGKICQTHPPTPDPEFFTKNPLHKKAKTDRTLKKPQKRRDGSTKKKIRDKNGQHLPLTPYTKSPKKAGLWGLPCLSPLGAFRAFSEQLSEFSLAHHICICNRVMLSIAKRASKAKKKKKPGAGKTCSVKKRACEGAEQNAPSPDKKALDAVRPWVPVTHWLTKQAVKIPQKEGTNPPPSRGLPLALTRARGW